MWFYEEEIDLIICEAGKGCDNKKMRYFIDLNRYEIKTIIYKIWNN